MRVYLQTEPLWMLHADHDHALRCCTHTAMQEQLREEVTGRWSKRRRHE